MRTMAKEQILKNKFHIYNKEGYKAANKLLKINKTEKNFVLKFEKLIKNLKKETYLEFNVIRLLNLWQIVYIVLEKLLH